MKRTKYIRQLNDHMDAVGLILYECAPGGGITGMCQNKHTVVDHTDGFTTVIPIEYDPNYIPTRHQRNRIKTFCEEAVPKAFALTNALKNDPFQYGSKLKTVINIVFTMNDLMAYLTKVAWEDTDGTTKET